MNVLLRELHDIRAEGTSVGLTRFVRHKLAMRGEDIRPPRERNVEGWGVLGAGTYVATVHLPILDLLGESFAAIVSRGGRRAASLASLYGFGKVCADVEQLLDDPCVQSVLIATPHHLHPGHLEAVVASADRYVYCEKPVAIDEEGLARVERLLADPSAERVGVGFNRRFAPAVRALRARSEWRDGRGPMEFQYRVNFGARTDNAMSDPAVGGGRIHGAACHYVDLIAFLAGFPISRVAASALQVGERPDENTFAAVLELEDGSVGSLAFTSEGDRTTDVKEEIRLSWDGHSAVLSDFRRLVVDGKLSRFRRHAHGARATWENFLETRDRGAPPAVGLADGVRATRATLAIQESIRSGRRIDVPPTHLASSGEKVQR